MTDLNGGGIWINEQEMAALDGEGAELFHLYVAGILPCIDPCTGIAGGANRYISYQRLRDSTMRVGRPGVKGEMHDKSKLRRMIDRLEELGLVIRHDSENQYLILECPLATRDEAQE